MEAARAADRQRGRLILPPCDYPPSEDTDWTEKVAIPLAQGAGIACFYAEIEGETAAVAAMYAPGHGEAIDPDWRTRAREAVRAQGSARLIAQTMGLEAVEW